MSDPSDTAVEAAAAAPTTERPRGKPVSRGRQIRARLVRRPQFWAGSVLLSLIVLMALVGNVPNIYDYTSQDPYALLKPPSAEHWFGTDSIGQDLYARVIAGLQKSLIIGLLAGPMATVIAAVLGSLAGYLGGAVEAVISWVINLLLALPVFYVLLVVSPLLSKVSWVLLVLVLACFGWMVAAQVVKNMTKSLREREFVKAARFMGVSTWTTLRRHIIPNVASLLIIDACLGVVGAILGETALSYFGLGIQAPNVSLGSLLQDGQAAAVTSPWLFVFPALFLVLLLSSVNLLGDALRDAIDPTSEVNRA
ncbi:MAG: ABC transporter permease [Actinomycetia bacterium]|nr:ABC transporter permease [Actinomycetes bacterium]